MIARPINSWGASAQQSQAGVGWDIPESNLLLGLLQGKNPLAQGWLNLASKTPGRSQLYGAWRYGQRLGVWGGKYVAILCLTMSHSPTNPVFLSSSLQSMSALFLYVPALHKWPLLIIHESRKRTSTLPSCLRTAQLPWQPQKYILVEHPKPKHIRQWWWCMQCAHVSLHNSLLVHLSSYAVQLWTCKWKVRSVLRTSHASQLWNIETNIGDLYTYTSNILKKCTSRITHISCTKYRAQLAPNLQHTHSFFRLSYGL